MSIEIRRFVVLAEPDVPRVEFIRNGVYYTAVWTGTHEEWLALPERFHMPGLVAVIDSAKFAIDEGKPFESFAGPLIVIPQ